MRLDDVLVADERGDRMAGALRDLGVGRGSVVAWQLPNGDGVAHLYRACWRLGAVAAPIHDRAGPAEVERLLERLDPTVVVDDPAALDGEPPPAAGEPGDRAAILWTAGSTGEPKGVIHTQASLGHKARLMVGVHGLRADDAVLMPAPLAHVSGLLNGVLVPQAAGMRAVFMARWDPDRAIDLIERERVTFMVGPPTFFLGLLGAPTFTPERVATLRLVSSGGAGVTPAFARDAAERLGAVVKRAYGSTEAPTVATSHAGDPVEKGWETDGRATGAVELRVGDRDELLVRGPELFAGYLGDGDGRDPDGWFHTGDQAEIDDEGWLTITGRLKDVIIRGGENVAVAPVEATLEAHPLVRQAVVVGAPDERLGERVAAFVVVDGPFDLDECRRWFEAQGATRFTWPERVEVVEEIPVLPAGKPDRAALRARL